MAWQNPKTNWTGADGVTAADFNRIEGNIQHLQDKEVDLGSVMLQAAKTVYVAYNGSTSGDGTPGNPYRYLNQALAALPKNLTGHTVTLMITGSSTVSMTSAALNITGFSNGRIALSAAAAGPTMLCSHSVSVTNGSIVDITGFTNVAFEAGLSASHNALIYASCPISMRTGSLQAFNYGSISCINTAVVMGVGIGVYAASGGRIWLNNIFTQSDVEYGLWAAEGSVIAYNTISNNSPIKTTTVHGGRILAGAQTSIPNY